MMLHLFLSIWYCQSKYILAIWVSVYYLIIVLSLIFVMTNVPWCFICLLDIFITSFLKCLYKYFLENLHLHVYLFIIQLRDSINLRYQSVVRCFLKIFFSSVYGIPIHIFNEYFDNVWFISFFLQYWLLSVSYLRNCCFPHVMKKFS